jgi:thiamine-phosphate pyrophosphorylase
LDKKILRIIDANQNRALEGIRVCEEIARFIIANKNLTLAFKNLRHKIVRTIKDLNIASLFLLNSRDSLKDAGRASIESELKRINYKGIFFANIQRAKESIRVLEEFSKLKSPKAAQGFKDIRYRLYQLEKKTYSKLRPICAD